MSEEELRAADLLSTAEAAKWAGFDSAVWRSMVSRGSAPKPVTRVGNSPCWTLEQLQKWKANRPGRGWRSGRSGPHHKASKRKS